MREALSPRGTPTLKQHAAITGLKITQTPETRDGRAVALSRKIMPDDIYPPYCSVPAYAVSTKFLQCALDKITHQQHYIGVEDAQTGVLNEACGPMEIDGQAGWLNSLNWENHSLAIHYGYLAQSDRELVNAMFHMHSMYSDKLCSECYKEIASHLGQTIDCRGRRWASTCALCPEGKGLCGGDWQYCDFGVGKGPLDVVDRQCAPNQNPCPSVLAVSCSLHSASLCSECPQGNGKTWCNGECKWCNNSCVPKEESSSCPLET